ncbi:MAG: DMT family transporter [Thermodesulfobacteriota bacterium]
MAATEIVPAPVAAAPRSGPALAYLGLTLATLGWAAAFILGKVALHAMTPLAVGAWRYVVATAVLLPFVLRGDGAGAAAAVHLRAAAIPLLVMVVAGGIVYPWLFLAALARTSAANTALLIAINPVLTLLLSPLVGERLAGRRVVGGLLAFAGATVVISRGDLAELLALRVDGGDLLALAAAACWATFNLASRLVVDRVPASTVNLAVFASGAVALLLLGIGEDPLGQLVSASPAVLATIAAMALVSSVMSGQLFLYGVRAAGVGRAVVFIYLVPVLTALLSVSLLDEELAVSQLAGGAAVVTGLLLTTRGGADA